MKRRNDIRFAMHGSALSRAHGAQEAHATRPAGMSPDLAACVGRTETAVRADAHRRSPARCVVRPVAAARATAGTPPAAGSPALSAAPFPRVRVVAARVHARRRDTHAHAGAADRCRRPHRPFSSVRLTLMQDHS
ncbi:hypothetical protein QZM46_21060 [Burkholderia vietnamiensis]|uniref:hypothetical protein n=1 Tax=Burkholderia vietnamiensis TaxID=60552 RepID=UPI000A7BFAE4|nr:hypothetical protein [Burkholderia vietnamiensis]MBR8201447.1 hypothetical protein [Burkholderia vietnamiensis]MCA8391614.1 hypothetical protein [Burkholderia vietnamiensis]MDN7553816.1 hypothetical protein [Burkholderia vietnamiensis]HDR8959651.1 hypothetical protein [Burkholderia vietnamiensis]HDR9092569.1 hypothetical protein [Burkholderia vietnamiensis]